MYNKMLHARLLGTNSTSPPCTCHTHMRQCKQRSASLFVQYGCLQFSYKGPQNKQRRSVCMPAASTEVSAPAQNSLLRGMTVYRVASGQPTLLEGMLAQPGPIAALFLTHWADLGSWELAQRLSKAIPSLQAGCEYKGSGYVLSNAVKSRPQTPIYAGVCRSVAWAWAARSRGGASRSCWTSRQTCCTLVRRAVDCLFQAGSGCFLKGVACSTCARTSARLRHTRTC